MGPHVDAGAIAIDADMHHAAASGLRRLSEKLLTPEA